MFSYCKGTFETIWLLRKTLPQCGWSIASSGFICSIWAMQCCCNSWNAILLCSCSPGLLDLERLCQESCNKKMSKYCNFKYFYFYTLHEVTFFGFLQKHFDVVCCRGGVREKIFEPWMESLKTQGCKFLKGKKVTDILLDEKSGCVSEVVCEKESFKADAIILAVGVSTLQEIIQNRYFYLQKLPLKLALNFCAQRSGKWKGEERKDSLNFNLVITRHRS